VTGSPQQSTRLIALLGDPVAHSLSPVFQNAAIRAAGVHGVYVALRTTADHLPGLLRGIAHAGGGGNVTVPHKRLAAGLLDRETDAVRRTGACNTFWFENGLIHGDNTDVAGLRAAVSSILGGEPTGARVLLLGAGGAARAVVVGLAAAGAARIDVMNRTGSAAAELAAELGTSITPVAALKREGGSGELRYDLVVNATSLGLRDGDPDPLPVSRLRPGTPVLDLVYRRGGTPWVRALQENGFPAADGTEMLIRQGAASFSRWWGVPAPLAAMREALER
jgi:shikimate dehydrogenase